MTNEKKLIEEMAEELENCYGRETELTERARKYLSQSKDKKMKSYDPSIYDGIHTIEITLQQWEYVGHITQRIYGTCKGNTMLDFDFDCEDDYLENDCNLKYHEEKEYFSATLKDPDGNTLDIAGRSYDFNNMIVKMEIVDYRRNEAVPGCGKS